MIPVYQNKISHTYQKFFSFYFQDKEYSSFEEIEEYILSNKPWFLSDVIYNHLEGRVGFLILLAIIYTKTKNNETKRLMYEVFKLILKDTMFFKNKLTWLNPPLRNNKHSKIFQRNIGTYLGLLVIYQNYIDDKNILFLAKNIGFDVELNEVSSIKYRKLLKQFFSHRITPQLADIYTLIAYYERSTNQAVLEAIICLSITNGFIEDIFLNRKIKSLIDNNNDFIINLIETLSENTFFERNDISISDNNIATTIMKNILSSAYEFCGEDFVSDTTKEYDIDSTLNPTSWLKVLAKKYPQKSLLFKNIIWREKIRLKLAENIFVLPQNNEESVKLLHQCYTSPLHTLFNIKFRINKEAFMPFFSSFFIGILPLNDFSNLNTKQKITDFGRKHKHIKFTMLLVKRFEKKLSWQGRSFRDNDEIDFLFFFLEKNQSLNDYKTTFGDKALSDFEIVGLIFWCLEIGIISTINL